MRFRWLLILGFSLLTYFSRAQTTDSTEVPPLLPPPKIDTSVQANVEPLTWLRDTRPFGSLYLAAQVAIPSTAFRRAIQNSFGNLGFGAALGFVFNPFLRKKPSLVHLGLDFGYLNYGIDKTLPVNYYPLKTTYNIYTLNGLLRVQPKELRNFAPFADGMLGLKIFNTVTKVDEDALTTVINNPPSQVLQRTNHTIFNYGVGLGFTTGNPHKLEGVRFFLRVLYLWGGPATYVVRGSVQLDNAGNVNFQTDQARTDMFVIHLGVSGLLH